MGSAVLYQLAKLGHKPVGLDLHDPPHSFGSSHGETRITRRAVGEGEDYVPLVTRSHDIWRHLAHETGEQLLVVSGALIIGPASSPSSHHGKDNFVRRSADLAQAQSITHEVLDSREIMRRYPALLGTRDDDIGYFEPEAGYVLPETCIRTQLSEAIRLGAKLRTQTRVQSIAQVDGGVEIVTSGGTLLAAEVVVAAGGWTPQLLGPSVARLLQIKRQVLHWFATDDAWSELADLPVLIWMHGQGDEDYFYGFPPLPEQGRIKVATEQYARSTTMEDLDRSVDPGEPAAMFRAHVQGRIAGVLPQPVASVACAYTVTPDHGFIIDRHPEQNRIFVISACSGHGFKHSAGIGQLVAETVSRGTISAELAPFSISRFG